MGIPLNEIVVLVLLNLLFEVYVASLDDDLNANVRSASLITNRFKSRSRVFPPLNAFECKRNMKLGNKW